MVIFMKHMILPAALAGVLLLLLLNMDVVTDITLDVVKNEPKAIIDLPNEYAYNNDYFYVQKSFDFVPYSRQDILNILYSIFDQGYETFTFYCPSEYADCIKDVEDITNNRTIITDIGNFVHPFNNYTSLKVITDPTGEVNIMVTKTYTKDMVESINQKLDSIFEEVITDDMDVYDKILKMHDYLIDTTSYDKDDESKNSGNAYGALIEGKAKCAGYADAMALVLSRLSIKNMKVASEKHVWNALYIDDEWFQIDLTWDDPIVENSAYLTDTIRHKFYMIDTDTLLSYDTEEHNFDKNVYMEVR